MKILDIFKNGNTWLTIVFLIFGVLFGFLVGNENVVDDKIEQIDVVYVTDVEVVYDTTVITDTVNYQEEVYRYDTITNTIVNDSIVYIEKTIKPFKFHATSSDYTNKFVNVNSTYYYPENKFIFKYTNKISIKSINNRLRFYNGIGYFKGGIYVGCYLSFNRYIIGGNFSDQHHGVYVGYRMF